MLWVRLLEILRASQGLKPNLKFLLFSDPNSFKFKKPSTSSSHFVKKAAILQEGGKNFRFNFNVEPHEADNLTPVPAEIEFTPSGNSFKFNFDVEALSETS